MKNSWKIHRFFSCGDYWWSQAGEKVSRFSSVTKSLLPGAQKPVVFSQPSQSPANLCQTKKANIPRKSDVQNGPIHIGRGKLPLPKNNLRFHFQRGCSSHLLALWKTGSQPTKITVFFHKKTFGKTLYLHKYLGWNPVRICFSQWTKDVEGEIPAVQIPGGSIPHHSQKKPGWFPSLCKRLDPDFSSKSTGKLSTFAKFTNDCMRIICTVNAISNHYNIDNIDNVGISNFFNNPSDFLESPIWTKTSISTAAFFGFHKMSKQESVDSNSQLSRGPKWL